MLDDSFQRRKDLLPPGKVKFQDAGKPNGCTICGKTFRCEMHPLGEIFIGDVPVPQYRYIKIVCPDGHECYEWIE